MSTNSYTRTRRPPVRAAIFSLGASGLGVYNRAMAQVNANPALVERFSKAIMAARNLSERAPNLLTQPQKLKLYALFQQASKGPPPSEPPPPGTVNDLDHAKWEAWRDVRAISNQQAMESYSQIIENLEELVRASLPSPVPPPQFSGPGRHLGMHAAAGDDGYEEDEDEDDGEEGDEYYDDEEDEDEDDEDDEDEALALRLVAQEVAPQVTATVWSTAAIGVGAGDKLDVPLVFDATSRCTYSFSIVSGSGPVGFRINTVPPQPAPLLSLYESTAEGTLEVLGPALLMVTLDNSAATFNSVELRCRVCLEPIAALAEESRYKMRKAMYEKVLERAAAADGLAKAARMQREAVDKAATRLEELRRAVSSARSELTGLVSTLRAQKMELALGKRELQTLKRTLREKVAQK